MADNNLERRIGSQAAMVRWLATAALVIAVVALIWAIRADIRAGDALDASRLIPPTDEPIFQ